MPEPRTSKPEYGPYIIRALNSKGEAPVDEVLEETYRLMKPRLHPADLEQLPGGSPGGDGRPNTCSTGYWRTGMSPRVMAC
jgi:hypothetical protein